MELPRQAPTDLEVAFVTRLKVAVATAIIRCKPSQMTAGQYAEKLGQRLRGRELDWKRRAERLESELLLTRQKLAVARMKDAVGFPATPQPTTDWDTANPGQHSGSWQDQRVGTAFDDCPEFAFPTPPSSVPTDPLPGNSLEERLKQSAGFLNCLADLNALPSSEAASGDDLTMRTADAMLAARDTALRGLEAISGHVRRRSAAGTLPWRRTGEALAAVGRLSEWGGAEAGTMREELVRGLTACLETFLHLIVANDRLHNHQEQNHLCSLVISLSSTQALSDAVLRSTLTHLLTLSAGLRRSLAGASPFDPTPYENGAYLLAVLEGVLLSPRTVPSPAAAGVSMEGSAAGRASGAALAALAQGLEGCSLHLMEEFPLFCRRVWQILSIVDWLRFRP